MMKNMHNDSCNNSPTSMLGEQMACGHQRLKSAMGNAQKHRIVVYKVWRCSFSLMHAQPQDDNCTIIIKSWMQTNKIFIDVTILPLLEMQLQRAGSAVVPHAIPGCRPLEHARQAMNQRCAPKKKEKKERLRTTLESSACCSPNLVPRAGLKATADEPFATPGGRLLAPFVCVDMAVDSRRLNVV